MSVPAILDHVVLAGPSLAGAVAHVEELTGVRAAPGGQHPTGTANALIAFTREGERVPWYLEVIGPDPEQRPGPITTFGIDRRTGPGVATFAVHPEDIEAAAHAGREAGADFLPLSPLSRRTPAGDLLEWSLVRVGPATPDPVIPFLIDWGSTSQPGLGRLPTLELLGLHAEHPDPAWLRPKLAALGVDLELYEHEGPPALVATVAGPDGPVELR